MSTQILLISHALTQWNIEGRIQGHTDVPLHPLGRKMAAWLADQLVSETIHAVYSSDLKRAYQTALPVAEQKSLKVIQDIRLREGRVITQERSNTYPTLPFTQEVETESDLRKRMTAVLSEVALAHNDQTVLVVSHGGSLEVFITHLLEESEEKLLHYKGIRMALNRIRYDAGKWHCISLNECSFPVQAKSP